MRGTTHRLIVRFVLAVCCLSAGPAWSAQYYVAPDGDDAAPGTLERPFASLGRAQDAASPGDTVWVRGGVYKFEGDQIAVGIDLTKSGEEGRPIRYWAYRDETPVFDFFDLRTAVRIKGIRVAGDYLHLRGLEVRGVQQILTNVNESWAIRVEGGASHNIFELLDLHHNEGPGLFIADGGHNLVLNCDAHHNYDPDRRGENADGFGVHSDDPGNVIRGCRAWHNSDDGYDLINCPAAAVIEGCWAWHNGFVPDTDRRAGNGAGIKSGGFGLDPRRFPSEVPRHIVRRCVSFDNRTQGFYANHHPGGLDFIHNTAFNNPIGFDLKADQGAAAHRLYNNVSLGNRNDLGNATRDEIDDHHNTWNAEARLTTDQFQSTDPRGVDGPRGEDGALPGLGFLHLSPRSRLIDAGKDLGGEYQGEGPDLGAYERR